jgi:hypothetical protein
MAYDCCDEMEEYEEAFVSGEVNEPPERSKEERYWTFKPVTMSTWSVISITEAAQLPHRRKQHNFYIERAKQHE